MKRLALLLPAMRMGGAEKIALNFVEDLIKHYEVTLVLNKVEGELLSLVPKEVCIIEDRLLGFHEILKEDLKHFRIFKLYQDAKYYVKVKARRTPERNYRYLVDRSPRLKENFDIAIAYVANVSTQIFCLADRIRADKKIAWIHGETTELKDIALYNNCYRTFDKIYAVSNVTKMHFLQKFPECASITEVYYNPINIDDVRWKAKQPIDIIFDKNLVNIVSVGRVTPEKGFDMLPAIVSILKTKGINIHWYLIGDGSELQKIKQRTQMLNVSENITFMGMLDNPYPYIKNCDIYVQPSYEEGYSTTICEAGILGKSIVGTTTSGGIREQVVEGESALLANPTPMDIASKIEYLIEHPEKRMEMEKNIRSIDFSNKKEIDKLLEVAQ